MRGPRRWGAQLPFQAVGERSVSQEWEANAHVWAGMARTPGFDVHFEGFNWPAFSALLPEAGRRVLDLGGGEGRVGALLRERGHTVTGVDAAATLAEMARATDVVVADGAHLPLDDGSFDLVVAFMSLQGMDDARGAVREAVRVLVAGGLLVAAVVHPLRPRISRATPGSGARTSRCTAHATRPTVAASAFAFHQVHRTLEDWLGMFLGAGPRHTSSLAPTGHAGRRVRHPSR